jgi:hypothetical protein
MLSGKQFAFHNFSELFLNGGIRNSGLMCNIAPRFLREKTFEHGLN